MIVISAKVFDSLTPKLLTEADSQSGFNLIPFLKTLDNHALNEWLRKNTTFVGAGSSRNAYVLKDMTCLKIAISKAGLEQNKQEYLNSMKESEKNHYSCFSKIYDADIKNFRFLHVEMAKTAKYDDFIDLLSLNGAIEATAIPTAMYMFNSNFKTLDPQTLSMLESTLGDPYYNEKNLKSFILSPRFMELSYRILKGTTKPGSETNLRSMFSFFKDNGLKKMIPGDVSEDDNWGVVWRDNIKQLIIIDSGFSEDIYWKYYV